MRKKIVFVTGSASGIGLQIGKTFLKQGDFVVFSDVNEEALHEVINDLSHSGYECAGKVCDVTSEQEIKNTINSIVNDYGRLDVLVNNAGLQHVAPIEEFSTDKFEQMIKIMLVAAFVTTKHAFPVMKKQGFGRIINIASINGVIGFSGKAAYNSAKHGIIGLTKVAALESAEDGITVNALCPGYVDTPLVRGQIKDLAEDRGVSEDHVFDEVFAPLIPQKRFIEVQEVADYATFLASEKAKGVTGQAVLVDGGYTAQ